MRGRSPSDDRGELAGQLWRILRGDPDQLRALAFTGPAHVLPSAFDVTGTASASVGVACLAVAELAGRRSGTPAPTVVLDAVRASAAFLCERLVSPLAGTVPELWGPISGDYRASDGWIRLHAVYEHHRRAALAVLGAPADRESVASAVAGWRAEALQDAVVDAGGCAAAMRDRAAWAAHPHGRFAVEEPALSLVPGNRAPLRQRLEAPTRGRPLAGVRVLDLTRVMAGPVATRFLAAYGADVMRIDPPGFEEVPALLLEMTAGKRCASFDLARDADRRGFEVLVAGADVLVHGLRPGALAALGFDAGRLAELNPALIVATLDAYGWTGPWAERRGFDSLVQMSCGIAAEGARQARTDRPLPLPAQALDHTTGYLLAAGVCRAVTERLRSETVWGVRGSLVGTANLLIGRPDPSLGIEPPRWPDEVFEVAPTDWGDVRRVRFPGAIAGIEAAWSLPPGRLGRHDPRWS